MQTDLLILGGGPAGYYCALQGARQGLKPILVEKDALGGTGLRWGCLPVKYMMDRIRAYKTKPGLWNGGITGNEPLTGTIASSILAGCRGTMADVSRRMEETLQAEGVTVLYGNPVFNSPHQLKVGDRQIIFKKLVLATGTEASPPPGVVIDGYRIITHREAVNLQELPASLVILGGDVEGLEFASMFSEMGTRVTVLEMLPQMLAGMDDDLTMPLFKRLKANGVSLHGSAPVASVSASPSGAKVITADSRVFDADYALVAMARRPVLPDGFEKTGLNLINERIQMDDNCKTQMDHIYCIGDLNGRMEMAHAALQQGILLADHLAKGTPVSWSYGPLPRAMFTLPQNGGAGLQEKELQDQGTPYRKAVVRWADTWRGAGQADPEGFLKVLAGEDGTLLGIWMTGHEISEQIGLMGMLLEQGATVNDLKRQLFVHPTLSEALLQAVLQLS